MSGLNQTRVMFHCHTTFSHDGLVDCSRLAELGEQNGFDFIFLSDHFEHLDALKYAELCRQCQAINKTASCKLIPGYEKSWEGIHICAFHLPEWRTSQDFGQWCSLVNESGGLVAVAHPAKYRFDIPHNLLEGSQAVEVWNSKWPYDGKLYPHPGAVALLKTESGQNKIALAGQDVHKESDFNRLAVVINQRCETADEVIQQVRKGNFQIRGNWLSWSAARSKAFSIPLRIYQRIRLTTLFAAFNMRQKLRRLFGKV